MRLSGSRRPKLPWLGYRAIRHLDGLLNPDWKILEFGSGMSTMWFAKRCHRVVSVEDNELWYLKVKKMLEEHGVTNVEYKFKNTNEYHILDEYTDGYFDFILIDGVQRDKCARSALPKIREGGYIPKQHGSTRPP
jgi:predicted O-methyltransferase YrrM